MEEKVDILKQTNNDLEAIKNLNDEIDEKSNILFEGKFKRNFLEFIINYILLF